MKVSSPAAATSRGLQMEAAASAAPGPVGRLLRLASGNHVLALADQAVVSGTNFLTLIVIARATDPAELGVFAIGSSILGVAVAVQHSLVSLPYSVQRHDAPEPAGHAFASLIQGSLLSAAGTLLLALAALALAACGMSRVIVGIAWALAAALPFVLAKEFARQFAFAHFDMARALILDAAMAAIQFAALGWLAFTGRMSAPAAYGALGLSCGATAAVWLYAARAEFAFRPGQLQAVMRQSWALGKWLFVSRAAVLVQGYATYWLSSAIAGAAATGLFAACMSVVSFVNPVLFGLWNFLAPRSVLAWKEGGGAGLLNRALRDLLLLGALTGAFCIVVLAAGDEIMHLFYAGRVYAGQGHVVAVLALSTLVWALSIPASNALTSMECARPMAAVSGSTAALNVVLVWWLMTRWGLPGAAYAILIANAVGTLGRWTAFLTVLRKTRP